MASIIDNKRKTMLESLKNSLKQADKVDILTAFFYFSGFDALADELKDKKIRILVGNTIDPDAIEELCNAISDGSDEELDLYAKRNFKKLNYLQKKQMYIDSFVGLFNKSSLSEEFDQTESQEVFKMFLAKLNDGTLEIRLTNTLNHAKAFILTNRYEYSCFGDQKGVVFTGSSNFTYNGLLGQGEMNERFSDNDKYDEYYFEFERMWQDGKAIDIAVDDETAQRYATELKIPNKVKIDIFTHNLKSKSGAILHKLVFIFKMAFIKALSKKIGYPIPIFCDSPNGREVEHSTIRKILAIIKRDFSDHQLFIASIFDYKEIFPNANIIQLNGKLFDQDNLFNYINND